MSSEIRNWKTTRYIGKNSLSITMRHAVAHLVNILNINHFSVIHVEILNVIVKRTIRESNSILITDMLTFMCPDLSVSISSIAPNFEAEIFKK